MLKTLALLTLLAQVRAQTFKTSLFQKNLICATPFGSVLGVYDKVRTTLGCSVLCSKIAACRSFTYNATSRTCSPNTMTLAVLPETCGGDVIYGEMQMSPTSASTTTVPTTLTVSQPTSTVSAPTTSETLSTTAMTTSTTTILPPTSTDLMADAYCQNGTRYDPSTDACVQDCSGPYSDTFQRVPERWVDFSGVTNATFVTKIYDPYVCMDMCMNETAFTCKTFNYQTQLDKCQYGAATPFTHPFLVNSNYISWQRDCQ